MKKPILMVAAISVMLAGCATTQYDSTDDVARTPDQLNDLELAHVAYTADLIDIQYAHLALGLSQDPSVREFAKTMIRDHEAVNEQALALLAKLEVQPQNNFLSQSLIDGSVKIIDELSQLRGNDGQQTR